MKQPSWTRLFARNAAVMARALKPLQDKRKPPRSSGGKGEGDWLAGMVISTVGPRRYWLFRPAGVKFGERLPLMVMLHGCQQDAKSFAESTRMNAVASRERFLVLYPEQNRLSNGQGCWNWFDTKSGRAQGEAAWLMQAVDHACLFHAADRQRVAVAGLSAGASMAALLATRYPDRFQAVVMHSGIPPGAANSMLSAVEAMRGRSTAAAVQEAHADWPPLMIIHGDADAVVSAENADAAAQLWSRAAGAHPRHTRELQRGKRYPMQVTDFKRGAQLVATRVRVAQLGHAWSGGAAGRRFSDAKGPDSSRMAWAFAAKQFAA